jgi:Tol biopolymer transport system component
MIGTRLAHYEITSHLGTGGMGEVYQATDLKLGRSVAIKLLPTAFASDQERLSRFRREAQVLASLNHPNIAQIYGLEESGDTRCIVMELVEGETLQTRIKRGPLPADEAVTIAKQIAEALEAAHEKGVVHRDLKPGNVMLTADGRVKVLDFGLAKGMSGANASSATSSNSPTMASMAATNAGVILGTAAYMSPEQARGKTVDRRSDIWAFGAVLYEMLTGHRAFPGDDLTDTLASVVKLDPKWDAFGANVPSRVRQVVRVCLQKDPRQRAQAIGDMRLALEGAFETATPHTAAAPARTQWLWPAVAVAAVLLAAISAIPAMRYLRETAASETRLQVVTPLSPAPTEFALSPDGRRIVFVASGDGTQRLWLRDLDKTDAQPMMGTDGADFPFWSGDGRSIGYFASGKLFRIEAAGGLPQVVANASAGRGGAWNASGTIIFAPSNGPLLRVAASGGDPVAVTRLDSARQTSHRFPQFLPDGRHFLFYVQGTAEAAGIYLASLDGPDGLNGGEPKRLAASSTGGAYLSPDRVIFVKEGALVAQRLDVAGGVLTGDPLTISDQVAFVGGTNQGGFSVSADGRIAYRATTAPSQLSWFDRMGKALGVATEPDSSLASPELSPDGRRVAVQRKVQNNTDIWLRDLARSSFTRFTVHPAGEQMPVWSPEGSRIVFESNRAGAGNLYVKASNGVGAEELLLETPNNKAAQSWSKDGRFLLYVEVDPKTGNDLWVLDLMGNDRKPRAVANSASDERMGQFSPDGRWVAYATNESGRFEIVVQPFPEPANKWQVSTNGGSQPRWRADSKELYFLAPDGKLMATPVTASGPRFEAGSPAPLFPTRLAGTPTIFSAEYAVAADGRFLINQPVEDFSAAAITIIQNWNVK